MAEICAIFAMALKATNLRVFRRKLRCVYVMAHNITKVKKFNISVEHSATPADFVLKYKAACLRCLQLLWHSAH